MKIKTSDLIGPALDWAVAKCEGVDSEAARLFHDEGAYNYSIDWSQGGPIIEREGIELLCNLTAIEAARFSCGAHADWQAFYRNQRRTDERSFASTPLTAAMRCYVASKLGDEVEIPEELK